MKLYRSTVQTPLGPMALACTERALVLLEFADNPERIERHLARRYADHDQVEDAARTARYSDAVAAYFAGDLDALTDLDCDPAGTPFQQQVWQALRDIPVGETLSYGELAGRLGNAGASRAVGLANGRNPIAVVIPCHRVIGADGSLTGYAAGTERKRWLLAHETRDLFHAAG